MAKLVKSSVNQIIYGNIEIGIPSQVEKFDLWNNSSTDEDITVTELSFPEYVYGKITDSVDDYASSIVGSFEIPYGFLNTQKYFMGIDGATIPIIEDVDGFLSETGIYLGTGQSDKTLLVDIMVCLQTEEDYILEDETGNFLEVV